MSLRSLARIQSGPGVIASQRLTASLGLCISLSSARGPASIFGIWRSAERAMSSRSRPKRKEQAPPPPPPSSSASAPEGQGWCASCGRLLPSETKPSSSTPRKYCSASCRSHARTPSLAPVRLGLTKAYHELLTARKVGSVVLCSEAERRAFDPHPPGSANTNTNASNGTQRSRSNSSDDPDEKPVPVQLPILGSNLGANREEARRAARRLVVFGFPSQGLEEERKVEAVQDGKVVEGSFAKGEWGVRWC